MTAGERRRVHPEDFPYGKATVAAINFKQYPGMVWIGSADSLTLVSYSLARGVADKLPQKIVDGLYVQIDMELTRWEGAGMPIPSEDELRALYEYLQKREEERLRRLR